MTPILNAAPESPEAYYTELHVEARKIAERTIEVLKARFRCLLFHKVLFYAPEVASTIVNACVVLHNICNGAQIPIGLLNDEEVDRETKLQGQVETQPYVNNVALQEGFAMRSLLVERLWVRRDSGS